MSDGEKSHHEAIQSCNFIIVECNKWLDYMYLRQIRPEEIGQQRLATKSHWQQVEKRPSSIHWRTRKFQQHVDHPNAQPSFHLKISKFLSIKLVEKTEENEPKSEVRR